MIEKNKSAFAVLFVDDEEKARKMFVRLVSSHFTVLTACDVKEAIEVMEKEGDHIGVLITDQRMPGQLGVDLLRHVRKEYPKVIRLLTTAYSDLSDAIDAVNTGEIFRYINKPWNVDELLIDLNLAMGFFTLQQDRSQLIQEKLSVSQQQTTINTLKNLIMLAGSQSHYSQPLRAIESLLQQTADPYTAAKDDIPIVQSGYWEKEIQHTENMLNIGRALSQTLDASNTAIINNDEQTDWQSSINSLSNNSITLDVTDNTQQNHFSQQGLNHLLSAIPILKADDIDIHITNDNNAIQITAHTNTPSDWLAKQIVTPTDSEAAQQIGKLIGASILAYQVGGSVKLGFNNSNLETMEISLPSSSTAPEGKDIEGGIWMEDLFVLYS